VYFLLFFPVFACTEPRGATHQPRLAAPLSLPFSLSSSASLFFTKRCALFSLTALAQPFPFQLLPHSFFILSSALSTLLVQSLLCKGGFEGTRQRLCSSRKTRPAHYTLFQVPYPVTPLFATLTKTTGVCTNSSHSGTPQSPLTSPAPPLPLTLAVLQHTIPPARQFQRNRTSRGGAIL
jgi:hypothetical protein